MNPLSQKLKNPSLTLYAFHLIGDVWQEQREDAGQLWQTLAQLAEPFALPDLQNFPHHLINEQGRDARFLRLLPNRVASYQTGELSCNIYPVRVHDAYAVDLTVFFKNKTLELSELSALNPHGCLLPKAVNASLGQTLLFYAEPLNGMMPDQTLADQCLQALWGNGELPKFIMNKGQLFGSPLFEYEEITDIPASQATHVLIWFGTNPQTLDLATEINDYFIKFFCQRHKIRLVRQLARQSYKEARVLYRQLESKSQEFSRLSESIHKGLEDLKSLLREIPANTARYTQHLRNLNDHKTTLLANAENYGQSLAAIFARAISEDNMDCWRDFHDTANRYRQQIEIDLAYLTPGQFQQLAASIQSLSLIETLKHEFTKQEQLESLVVFIASTLESAAISAKLDYQHHIPQAFFGCVYDVSARIIGEHLATILAHLGVGILFGGLALFIIFGWQAIRRSRQ